ncbi:MAG: hypothetical protein RLZZ399_355 [Verrucomicrobiota bacterium]|jgi:lysophospholipase L1-like esterase
MFRVSLPLLRATIAFSLSAASVSAIGQKDGGPLPPLGQASLSGALLLRSGQSLAFLGDSITDFGDDMPAGYCRLVIDALRQFGVDVTPVYAGHGGDRSIDMLRRLDQDVLSRRPDWMTLSCGVNDAWLSAWKRHGQPEKVIPVEQFASHVTAIVERCTSAGTRVILLTPTLIGEDPGSDDNRNLAFYAQWLRDFAKAHGLPLVDLHSAMQAGLSYEPLPGKELRYKFTYDGVHLAPRGHRMVARAILRALGMGASEIDSQYDRWMDLPQGWITWAGSRVNVELPDGTSAPCIFQTPMGITAREHRILELSKQTVLPWSVPQDKVIPEFLESLGGKIQRGPNNLLIWRVSSLASLTPSKTFASIKELVASEEIKSWNLEIQKEADRRLQDAVDKARPAFQDYVDALSEAQKRAMQEDPFR